MADEKVTDQRAAEKFARIVVWMTLLAPFVLMAFVALAERYWWN